MIKKILEVSKELRIVEVNGNMYFGKLVEANNNKTEIQFAMSIKNKINLKTISEWFKKASFEELETIVLSENANFQHRILNVDEIQVFSTCRDAQERAFKYAINYAANLLYENLLKNIEEYE